MGNGNCAARYLWIGVSYALHLLSSGNCKFGRVCVIYKRLDCGVPINSSLVMYVIMDTFEKGQEREIAASAGLQATKETRSNGLVTSGSTSSRPSPRLFIYLTFRA